MMLISLKYPLLIRLYNVLSNPHDINLIDVQLYNYFFHCVFSVAEQNIILSYQSDNKISEILGISTPHVYYGFKFKILSCKVLHLCFQQNQVVLYYLCGLVPIILVYQKICACSIVAPPPNH